MPERIATVIKKNKLGNNLFKFSRMVMLSIRRLCGKKTHELHSKVSAFCFNTAVEPESVVKTKTKVTVKVRPKTLVKVSSKTKARVNAKPITNLR